MEQNRHGKFAEPPTGFRLSHLRFVLFVSAILFLAWQSSAQVRFPAKKENLWIFVMAGQSNMAGMARIESQDTVTNPRILVLDNTLHWHIAREPLHKNTFTHASLDCGMSFARELLRLTGDPGIKIGLVPCAIGSTSVEDWLGDSLRYGKKILSNLTVKTQAAMKQGTVKAILWHQGEQNANPLGSLDYNQNLEALFRKFRIIAGQPDLPIILGELGSFLGKNQNIGAWGDSINAELRQICLHDRNCMLVRTQDLKDRGDGTHFDSESQRILGIRYAVLLRRRSTDSTYNP
jgi:hypothetical protein